jgi:RNA polymerase sigma-70 factor (ECF subfamily)
MSAATVSCWPEQGLIRSRAAFYHRHERPVLAFVGRVAGSTGLAADVMAETFAAAFESRARFDPPAVRLASGCSGLPATRSGRACAAAVSRRARVNGSGSEPEAQRSQISRNVASVVEEWLDGLPADQREAVR